MMNTSNSALSSSQREQKYGLLLSQAHSALGSISYFLPRDPLT